MEYTGSDLRCEQLPNNWNLQSQLTLPAFHHRTAARAVDVILHLGGIYVKIGQFASTMGAGILEDAYIEALQPLQDGVPPRSLEEVSGIIEASVGQSMADLFQHFEPEPVGWNHGEGQRLPGILQMAGIRSLWQSIRHRYQNFPLLQSYLPVSAGIAR